MTAHAPSRSPARAPARPRQASLDVLRGLTMAFMVIVNTPGSWSHVYAPLRHAPWDGCTPTDLVFPFFLFVVGAAMWHSMRDYVRPARGDASKAVTSNVRMKVVRRVLLIFAFGLLLNAYPKFDLAHLRTPGVLQRIALCVLLAWVAVVYLRPRACIAVAIALLAGYAYAIWFSGLGASPDANLARSLDLAVLGPDHLYRNSPTDPEGILSTIPATASVLIGVFVARMMTRADRPLVPSLLWRVIAVGAGLVAAGLLLGLIVPLNKPLWSPSYVLFTGGLATIALATFSFLVDLGGARPVLGWLEVFGRNAMTLFVGSGLLGRTLANVKVETSNGSMALNTLIYERAFARWLSPMNASLAYALAHLAVWWCVLWWMNRRGWIWKV